MAPSATPTATRVTQYKLHFKIPNESTRLITYAQEKSFSSKLHTLVRILCEINEKNVFKPWAAIVEALVTPLELAFVCVPSAQETKPGL